MNVQTPGFSYIKGRCAEESIPIFDVMFNSRLGADLNIVADIQVSNNTYLAGNHTILPDLGRTGNPGLGCDYGVLADLDIVCDLNQVVDLDAFTDDRRPKGWPGRS